MKKIVLTISLSVMIYNINAQGDDRGKICLGAKVGLNLSSIYDTKAEDFKADAKLGFAAGLFLIIPIGNFIRVQPEILFS